MERQRDGETARRRDSEIKLLILSGSGIYQLMVYRRSGLGLWAFCRLVQ